MKAFDTNISLVDIYGPANANEDFDWKMTDVSDEVQYYFSIVPRTSSINNQNATVTLRNKISGHDVAKISFADKNILKFCDSSKDLSRIDNLNKKYELIWNVAENDRGGIIYFDFPISFGVS